MESWFYSLMFRRKLFCHHVRYRVVGLNVDDVDSTTVKKIQRILGSFSHRPERDLHLGVIRMKDYRGRVPVGIVFAVDDIIQQYHLSRLFVIHLIEDDENCFGGSKFQGEFSFSISDQGVSHMGEKGGECHRRGDHDHSPVEVVDDNHATGDDPEKGEGHAYPDGSPQRPGSDPFYLGIGMQNDFATAWGKVRQSRSPGPPLITFPG